jgi:hypothetical protein
MTLVNDTSSLRPCNDTGCPPSGEHEGSSIPASNCIISPFGPRPFSLVEDMFDHGGETGDNYGVLRNVVSRHWARVFSSKEIASVEGVITKSFVTSEDSPFDHQSHDWNIMVKLNDPYKVLYAEENKKEDQMEMEWETKYFPDTFWPELGDKIHVEGRLVYDCGHIPLRTEIHPPHMIVLTRDKQPAKKGKGVYDFQDTYVFIHGKGGYYNFPVRGKDYPFTVHIPPQPSPTSVPHILFNTIYGNIQPR